MTIYRTKVRVLIVSGSLYDTSSISCSLFTTCDLVTLILNVAPTTLTFLSMHVLITYPRTWMTLQHAVVNWSHLVTYKCVCRGWEDVCSGFPCVAVMLIWTTGRIGIVLIGNRSGFTRGGGELIMFWLVIFFFYLSRIFKFNVISNQLDL